jgi:nicotinamidase-related amidase
MDFQVVGDPHPWPRDAETPIRVCALLVVDMQEDYCSPGYYMAQAGYDTIRLREPVARIQRVLAAARGCGMQVLYTRHGRVPDLQAPSGPFPRSAARGDPGWQIVPELRPDQGETVIEKSTCNAFVSGELDRLLRQKGIRHLAICGNTIDVCVHSTLRAAVDLDYECLLLGDCCGAVNDSLHAWAIESVKVENGVFGTVANAEGFVRALAQ